ncbi:MAG: DUF805 domain-containing protein [Hyphomicrobiales bacterium]|nr:DUF805 domain-containing protein [Hyphomicrobiales bacterium]
MRRLLARFFGFSGRLDRQRWWTRAAIVAAMGLVQDAFVDEARVVALATHLGRSPGSLALVWAGVAAWWLAMIWIAAAACVRRLHDRGEPGGRILLWLLPGVVAAHWTSTHVYAWAGVALALAWAVVELGVLPGRDLGAGGSPPRR